MSATLTYAYGVVRSPRRPPLRNAPGGMPGGGAVRLLPAGPATWLVVSSVPARQYGEAALRTGLQDIDWVGRRALAHEAVVEHFLSAPAVLPMQLFTLFTSDESALTHIAGARRRITRILDRIERQHEWGLRLTWDEAAARQQVEAAYRKNKNRKGRIGTKAEAGSGTSYLARKRDLLNVNRTQLAAARAAAERIYRAIAREATAARRRSETEKASAGSRLLLDAALLVPVKRAAAFRRAVRRHARTLEGSGVSVALTGPWPPYNFI